MARSDEHVLLMFHHIDLELPNKNGECFDYVEVLPDLNKATGEKFCGSHPEVEPILSVGNKLSVSFHSDDSRGGKGFKSSVWEGVHVVAGSEISKTDSIFVLQFLRWKKIPFTEDIRIGAQNSRSLLT